MLGIIIFIFIAIVTFKGNIFHQGVMEVIDLAKEEELQKWKDYEAFEEINEQANLDVLSSRWVITQKVVKIKARLVVRGFQKNEKPQADAPTAGRESLRIFSSTFLISFSK